MPCRETLLTPAKSIKATLIGLFAICPLIAPIVAHANGAEQEKTGKELYEQQCVRCHQRDGGGVDGLYPSLRNAPSLWLDRKTAIRGVLAGRADDSVVNSPLMPTHGYLGNETIARTLTFLLQEWGPGGQSYTAEEVAAERLELLASQPAPHPGLPDVSPLADMDAVQYVTSSGPPMSVSEFDRARSLYYGHCTGCHGVLREGTAGSPLTPVLMRQRGTEYLQAVINYGSSAGMFNWGTSDALTAEEINMLARFLQHPVPQAPDMTEADVRASWSLEVPLKDRPEVPQGRHPLDELFVVTLHDVAQIALIHGPSRRVIGTVATGQSPHRVRGSASGRYLYVIARDGSLSMVDLYARNPRRVASVRVGYEARAVGASRHPDYADRYVLAGAYWPPQLVLLDGRTLEPLKLISTRGRTADGGRYHPEPRVSDIAGSYLRPEFIANVKETGRVYLFPYYATDRLQLVDIGATAELRAGTFSKDKRYFITPADVNAISVLDTKEQRQVAQIPARVFAGGPGVTYDDPEYGPVWSTSTMVEDEIISIGTDPEGHPNYAWEKVRSLKGPGSGSMFMASHPASANLWVDSPLNADETVSQSVAVFDKRDLDAGYRSIDVAAIADVGEGPSRVLQPTYDPTGREVWVVVWNPQDLNSAIVVIDDRTLKPLAVIDDPRLITPTRIYSLAALRDALSEN
jgi:nitrite reductase (NO-forming)/hydroxylamine reductase